jgi:hypothetical protein
MLIYAVVVAAHAAVVEAAIPEVVELTSGSKQHPPKSLNNCRKGVPT